MSKLPPKYNYVHEVVLMPQYFRGILLSYLTREEVSKAIAFAKVRLNDPKEEWRHDHLKMISESSVDDIIKGLKLLRVSELQEKIREHESQIEDCKQRIENVKEFSIPETRDNNIIETGISFLLR